MKKRQVFYLGILVIFGLVPLLWFKPGMLLKTADLRLPVTWEQWRELFFMWNHSLSTGATRLLDTSLILFWLPSALLEKAGFSLINTQKILFVFWFMLGGFCSYFMMTRLLEGKFRYLAALAATSFYLFNLWTESFWMGFKPPLVAGYALLPLIVTLLILAFEKKINYIVAALYIGFISLAVSSIGNNPSEFLGFGLPIFILFAFYFIKGQSWKNKDNLTFFVKFSTSTLLIFVVFNFFWIAPQALALYENISEGTYTSNKLDFLNWLEGLSYYTSFFNVVRLQGDWTWYAGCGDLYRDYGNFYRSNIFFIILSFFAPLLVLIGILTSKNRYKLTFFILVIVGIVLSMGAHFPFKETYLWMVRHIPLFWIVRSPYFKFGLLICLGYTFLIGVAVQTICHYIEKLKDNRFIYSFVFIIIILNMTYAHPVILGRMFHTKDRRTFLAADHIKIPDYVDKASRWLNSKKDFYRIYTLPGDSPWINEWDYVGFGSPIRHFIKSPVVFKYDPAYLLYSQGAINQSGTLVKLIEKSIYEGLTLNVSKILTLLNIGYILQENDVRYDFYKGPTSFLGDSPEFMHSHLAQQKGIYLEKTFGKWDFYRVDRKLPFVYSTSKIDLVIGNLSTLIALSYGDILDNPALIFSEELNEMHLNLIKKDLVRNLIIHNYNKNTKLALKYLENEPDKISFKYILSTGVIKPQMTIKEDLSFERQGFTKPEILFNGKEWRWLISTTGEPNLIINNPKNSNSYVNLRFFIYSYKRQRSLGIYVNDKLVKSFDIPTEEITEVNLPNINLNPGENLIKLQTGHQWDERNGQMVRFAFSEFAFGNYKFNGKFELPQSGQYVIKIYRSPAIIREEAPEQKKIILDDKELRLSLNNKKEFFKFKDLYLKKGLHTFEISQTAEENYYIEIEPVGGNMEEIKLKALEFERINPTEYKILPKANKPSVLIFNESYSDEWKAFLKEKTIKTHFKVNGYANAWVIDKIRESDIISLNYLPQKLFNVSIAVSLSSVGLALLAIIFLKQR